jgi:hypothetical protein
MSFKVMDVVCGIKSTVPVRTARPSPRDRPMYGRPGITMGHHLDEFDDFKDDRGRSFDQLIFFTLHGAAKNSVSQPLRPKAGSRSSSQIKETIMPPPPLLDAGKVASMQEKMEVDACMDKLKYGHLDQVHKCIVKEPTLELKRKREDEAQKEDKKQKTVTSNTATRAKVISYVERKKHGTGRHYF